jgi:hypothetical protein
LKTSRESAARHAAALEIWSCYWLSVSTETLAMPACSMAAMTLATAP